MLYQGRYAIKEVVFLLYLLQMLVGPRKDDKYLKYTYSTHLMTSASLKNPILFKKYILKNIENDKTFHIIYILQNTKYL